MCIRRETREKARRSLAFSRVSKPHTHITNMLRQCTSIVYKQDKWYISFVTELKWLTLGTELKAYGATFRPTCCTMIEAPPPTCISIQQNYTNVFMLYICYGRCLIKSWNLESFNGWLIEYVTTTGTRLMDIFFLCG